MLNNDPVPGIGLLKHHLRFEELCCESHAVTPDGRSRLPAGVPSHGWILRPESHDMAEASRFDSIPQHSLGKEGPAHSLPLTNEPLVE
ncbi:hypothetical protein N7457_003108 [Penicillium paradoxum]|uniref:uncharacterized protein n=1 Tax=Penicillium paradoxum TaxID=176176 RepID=UPI0025473A21|nr:uncharacterized protein N7457_003108 [Penicillium paradoxum]KAJ5788118.1 hypothetical protein N7457_003108 [Penicillium paradoxum]